jgi:hypothetical protein
MNTLYYGDNLKILRDYIKDESVDLIDLDPPLHERGKKKGIASAWTMRFVLIHFFILSVSVTVLFAQHSRYSQEQRAKLLSQLKKCEPRGQKPGCEEFIVADVVKLYKRGDHSVLRNLMDVAPNSDGALSEELGEFFSEILCDRPRDFLTAVLKRNIGEHENLLFLAAVADGGGMGCRNISSLRRSLIAIKKDRKDKLHRLAVVCLTLVNKYNSQAFRLRSSSPAGGGVDKGRGGRSVERPENRNYNVLFKDESGTEADSQITRSKTPGTGTKA